MTGMTKEELMEAMDKTNEKFVENGIPPQAGMMGAVVTVLAISFRHSNTMITMQMVNQFIGELTAALQVVLNHKFADTAKQIDWEDIANVGNEEEPLRSAQQEGAGKVRH